MPQTEIFSSALCNFTGPNRRSVFLSSVEDPSPPSLRWRKERVRRNGRTDLLLWSAVYDAYSHRLGGVALKLKSTAAVRTLQSVEEVWVSPVVCRRAMKEGRWGWKPDQTFICIISYTNTTNIASERRESE